MITTYRIPLITDPVTAGYASMAFTASRARTEQALRIGAAFAQLFIGVRDLFSDLGHALDCAHDAQALFAMSEAELNRRGLERSDIPAVVWKRQAPPTAHAG